MFHGRSDLLAGRDVPQAHGAVGGPSQDARLIPHEQGAMDSAAMFHGPSHLPAGRDVP
jgi:hypothetical protein